MKIFLAMCLSISAYAQEVPQDQVREEPAKVEAAPTIPMPKINGLIAVWGVHDSTGEAKANFRIRRAELKVSGQIVPELKYFLMIDAAKSLKEGDVVKDNDNKILQDIGIAYKIIDELELTVGQFKAPTTAEGLQSSSDLNLPERALVSRTFGDKRETGAMLSFKWKEWLKLSVMGSNGGSTNTNDKNTRKDAHARAEVYLDKAFSLGTFATYSDTKADKSYRNGVNFAASFRGFFLSAEAATGLFDRERVKGLYVDIGYDHEKKLRPVLRYETFEMLDVITRQCSAGVTYALVPAKAKLQLSYTFLRNAATDLGTTKQKEDENGNLVIANFQVAF